MANKRTLIGLLAAVAVAIPEPTSSATGIVVILALVGLTVMEAVL